MKLRAIQKSDLIRLDILLNAEVTDALSIIVHRSKAYNRGKAIVEKTKNSYSTPNV